MLNAKQNTLRKNNLSVLISLWFIEKVYREKIKPSVRRRKNVLCSFYPDCSEYGILSLKKHGFFRGWYKAIKRISKCNKYRHDESCVDFP